MRSTDRGLTWNEPDNLPNAVGGFEWDEIDFSREGFGVAAGTGNVVLFTADSGRHWMAYSLPEAMKLQGVFDIEASGNRAFIATDDFVYVITME
ncbi:MAG: hypothetical protein ACK4S4_10315 [Pyrinomonadaceae bacterium]